MKISDQILPYSYEDNLACNKYIPVDNSDVDIAGDNLIIGALEAPNDGSERQNGSTLQNLTNKRFRFPSQRYSRGM